MTHHVHLILATPGQLFRAACEAARDLSNKILKLADLEASPLAPGENADTRRHQLAKLGKQLAEAYTVIDQMVAAANGETPQSSDVTADAPETESGPIDPNAN